MKIFKMKDLGELYWLFNLKIEWDIIFKLISFSQEAYIDKILNWVNLQDSKMHITPIDVYPKTKIHIALSPELKRNYFPALPPLFTFALTHSFI